MRPAERQEHPLRLRAAEQAPSRSRAAAAPPTCQRCGYPVATRAMGCRNPCRNCGTVYPLGDCSD